MVGAGQRDYYEVLSVPRDADAKTIKDAFRELALEFHPDRNKAPEAEERFKEIAEAYGILSDPQKRAQYDSGGFAGVADFSPEDIFAGIDFGDIFGDFMGDRAPGFGFGGGRTGGGIFDRLFRHRDGGVARGRDVEVGLQVPLRTISTGGEETVRYTRPVSCAACAGTGAKAGTAPKSCDGCEGSGQKIVTQSEEKGVHFRQISTCSLCRGTGTVIDDPCPECDGHGQVEKEESLKVTVPPGAEEGLALRVAERGFPSADPNGKAGDLYVIVRSDPDPRFQRLGADLWRGERLEVADAVLGIQLRLLTLDGEVEVTIPQGTQPDEVLRLRGKGLPILGSDRRGDLNIRIEIHVPEHPTAKERELYEQLRALGEEPRRKWHWKEAINR